jgi:hypothetical protein
MGQRVNSLVILNTDTRRALKGQMFAPRQFQQLKFGTWGASFVGWLLVLPAVCGAIIYKPMPATFTQHPLKR